MTPVTLERTVYLEIDGHPVTVRAGGTLLEAARAAGVHVPVLCHSPLLGATGTCMVCVVEVKGVGLVPSCSSPAADGMQVSVSSEAVLQARRRAVQAILAEHYADCVAPCTLACPAGVDVQNYLKLIALGLPEEAAALVREANPFPGVHGRVCTRPCEDACRRQRVDEAVAICAAKRFSADREAATAMAPIPRITPTGRRVAVVGAGPAGLTCAYFLARMGHAVTVYEARPKPGGMLRYGIPSYRLPREVLDREVDYILRHGVELVTGRALGRDFSLDDLREQGFEAVFLATGAHRSQRLNVPGEDLPQVMSGIGFLARMEEGEPIRPGRRVAVIGGGNTAVDAARAALRLRAEEVILIYRRTRAEMPSHPEEVRDAEEEGVRLCFLAAPTAIEPGGHEGLRLRLIQMRLGEPDASGRPRPEPVPGSDFVLEVDSVIVAIGQVPDELPFAGVEGLQVGRGGTLKADPESQATARSGVFAGGDLTTGAATAVEAVGAGRRAAVAIHRYLQGESELVPARPFTLQKVKCHEELLEDEFAAVDRLLRHQSERERVVERIADFREVDRGMEADAAIAEARRCLECGCKAAHDCRLREVAGELGLSVDTFPTVRYYRPVDRSHPFIEFDPNRCIACGQCVRVCQEIQEVGALALRYRVATVGAIPGLLGTRCESCGQCLTVCPTGAIAARDEIPPSREVQTVCPYCGTGCGLVLGARGERVVTARADLDHSTSQGRLCVKGRFGWHFVNHPERLRVPLLRKNGRLEESSWDEALELITEAFARYRGPQAGVFGSPKTTNEEIYLTSKFARVVLGTNNVAQVAHLCHANTVRGLIPVLGSGAMTVPVWQIKDAACLLVIGCNPSEAHPIVAAEIRRAVANGAQLIIANPRWIPLCQLPHLRLPLRPGSDVALLMAMAKVILEDDLLDREFIAQRTTNFEAFAESLREFRLEEAVQATGVPEERIREAAHVYARSKPAIIFWSMGITQHSHGHANVGALAHLAMMTGNFGQPASGIAPLRGHNNVQGATDMGCTPPWYPGYQFCPGYELYPRYGKFSSSREKFEKGWGYPLPDFPGLSTVKQFHSRAKGWGPPEKWDLDPQIRLWYIIGADLVNSVAQSSEVRRRLDQADFVVVQDIFLTDTARLAHVVLPAASFAEKDGTFTSTDRRVQLVRKVVNPPGQARADWEIICELARRLGYRGFDFTHPAEIMNEIASLVPIYAGISHDRLSREELRWPVPSPDHPGTPVLHVGEFVRLGKAEFWPLRYTPSPELPDDDYPLIMTSGRVLPHFHHVLTRRVHGLNQLCPGDFVELNPADAGPLGIRDGDTIRVTSRRGSVITTARVSDRVMPGVVFKPIHFSDKPTNLLTSAEFIDPVGTTPNTKVCPVRVEKVV
ncbi:MAG: formate dehydrogenase subunit alpha [Bacillota bacterium]